MSFKGYYYTAKWARAGHPSIANVSFFARGDSHASKKADKIARELSVTNTPRTIQREGVGVVETLTSGVKKSD